MLYEDLTVKGAIKKALGKKPSKYGTPKQSNSSGGGRDGLDSPYDRQVRARANRPGGPSIHDSSAWEIVPGAEGGGPFESGRYLKISATQIADPFGGASRNPIGQAFGRVASGGRAWLTVVASAINGSGTQRVPIAVGSPVLSNRYRLVDLGANPSGRDRHRVFIMRGGANFMTVDDPYNSLVQVYRERDYAQIGIARYVETVNFAPNVR